MWTATLTSSLCRRLSVVLLLSLIYSLLAPPSVLTQATSSSELSCESPTPRIEVELSSSVSCNVFCFYGHEVRTTCTINTFSYDVRNHQDGTSPLPLNSSSTPHGTIKDFVLAPDEESISFLYVAPPSGVSEEIWVTLSTTGEAISNSPIDVTLISPPSVPFFSFDNQLFVIIFVVILCVVVGVLVVFIYSCVERRQRQRNKMERADVYARMYEEDIRIEDHEEGSGEGQGIGGTF